MLSAKEALELSTKNKKSKLEEVLKLITECCLKGERSLYVPRGMGLVKDKLQDLGYQLEFSSCGGYYVYWDNPQEVDNIESKDSTIRYTAISGSTYYK